MLRRNSMLMAALIGLASVFVVSAASAETITQALASTYSSNPEINSARAQTRADDENVPIARSGYRPIVSAFSTVTGQTTDTALSGDKTTLDSAVGIQITQDLFTGFRVKNAIRQSEAGVLASRELLRNIVQNVLFDAAQAYMDVRRDIQILDIRRRNVLFLEEQVRAANERFNVGENTRTDVAQARARLASARAAVSLAEANLAISRATYRRVVGHEADRVSDGFPYGRLVPSQLGQAIAAGQNAHPVIFATIHQADAEAFLVKQIEGELLPTVSVEGRLQHNESFDTSIDPNTASIIGRVTIPIYQGGAVSARVRQAKERYGLRKIEIDVARDQVRAAVVSAWAQAEASRGAISAAREGVEAAEIALSGVQEEQRVGQRTTLDVLDAQQELLNARETLVIAERDLVVANFALLSAMGRLDAEPLGLPVAAYHAEEHYRAVHDKWYGVRTPDGR
ncbi:MAG TPA: TolC family outer membrane protein [Propylenella sp.]